MLVLINVTTSVFHWVEIRPRRRDLVQEAQLTLTTLRDACAKVELLE